MKEFIRTLASRDMSFALIGLRCNSDTSTGKRKMEAGVIYKFLRGYVISDDEITVAPWRTEQGPLFDDYSPENYDIPHIQISAIVGQNGSGKSSIVEFLMRLINNMAASTFGEYRTGPAAEHLHYIDGIDGDMWYMLNHTAYWLRIRNCHVMLHEFLPDKEKRRYRRNKRAVFDNGQDEDGCIGNRVIGAQDTEVLKDLYSRFFYTLVSNHSIYAYNTSDFVMECNSDEKERLISAQEHDKSFDPEERCWLHGLFHKNDGYQIPLVITPFRRSGNIDINNENNLAKERLISLFATQKNVRTINGHLTVDSLSYRFLPDLDYGYEYVKYKLEIPSLPQTVYDRLRNDIPKLWGKRTGCELDSFQDKPCYAVAIEYLVYKTLKISKQYKVYETFYNQCRAANDYDYGMLEALIKSEAQDLSHVTRKVMQTLAYLLYDVYSFAEETQYRSREPQWENTIDLNQLAVRWHGKAIKGNGVATDSLQNAIQVNAILPPPFFETRINLYETNDPDTKIAFETLSSGERQQAYAISSLLYHLDNLNSVSEDRNGRGRIAYRNVNIILEEIELYFHPELQQQFIKFLLDGIAQMNLSNIKGINIMIVTHSPYVLSDIPRNNVLALQKEVRNARKINLKTFGANIHDILKNSFFLSGGAMGCFAQWEVGHIAACLKVHEWAMQKDIDTTHCPFVEQEGVYGFLERYTYPENGERLFSYEHFCRDFSSQQLLWRIGLIDEPVLRKVLQNEIARVFPVRAKEIKKRRIEELEREIARLKKE